MPLIHANQTHVAQTQSAVNKTEQDLVSAFLNTLEIHTRDVAQSALSVQIANRIVLASIKNVKTLVQDHVRQTPNVKWLTIKPFALATMDTKEIRTDFAHSFPTIVRIS